MPAERRDQRRRSRGACHACHIRKVRCDVSTSGVPCSQCSADKVHCLLRERKNRRLPLAFEQNRDASASESSCTPSSLGPVHPDASSASNSGFYRTTSLVNGLQSHPHHDGSRCGPNLPAQPQWDVDQPLPSIGTFSNFELSNSGSPPSAIEIDYDTAFAELENFFTVSNNVGTASEGCWSQPSIDLLAESPLSSVNQLPSPGNSALQGDVTEEPVVGTSDDRQFLVSQGCFRLPEPSVLRDIANVYFSFIHPNLPIINEADFWNLWDGRRFRVDQFSVLVLQAMIFASASFTPDAVLARCGFRDGRQARVRLYRKAKLLFDFGVEGDPIYLSQACLLLTYYAPNNNQTRINSAWLEHAIRFARSAKADRFAESGHDLKMYRTLKRLWWSCILRDRILPLGVRRHLHIDVDMSDQGELAFLLAQDLDDELGRSAVHDVAAQNQVFRILELACRLADALTPAIKILYTVENANKRLYPRQETSDNQLNRTSVILTRLFEWHEYASRMFPSPVNLGDTHRTTIIYANLLFIYFDAAVIALCSHSLLLLEIHGTVTNNTARQSATSEIARAVTDTADRTRELVQMNYAEYLPISVSAFLSLPFLLMTLNAMIATGTSSDAAAQRQLEIFAKAMKMQQIKYDGADFCHELLDKVMANVKADNVLYRSASPAVSSMMRPSAGMRDNIGQWVKRAQDGKASRRSGPVVWEDLLQKRPMMFLRLALHVDIALCTGGTPQETDFPLLLRRQKAL